MAFPLGVEVRRYVQFYYVGTVLRLVDVEADIRYTVDKVQKEL